MNYGAPMEDTNENITYRRPFKYIGLDEFIDKKFFKMV